MVDGLTRAQFRKHSAATKKGIKKAKQRKNEDKKRLKKHRRASKQEIVKALFRQQHLPAANAKK